MHFPPPDTSKLLFNDKVLQIIIARGANKGASLFASLRVNAQIDNFLNTLAISLTRPD